MWGNSRSLWQTTALRFLLLSLAFSSMDALDPAANANETFQLACLHKCLHLRHGISALGTLNARSCASACLIASVTGFPVMRLQSLSHKMKRETETVCDIHAEVC